MILDRNTFSKLKKAGYAEMRAFCERLYRQGFEDGANADVDPNIKYIAVKDGTEYICGNCGAKLELEEWMIKIENTDVYGFEAAIRGMRNPKNSWEKSDSIDYGWGFVVGQNDLALMEKLSKAGTDHAKFLRFITVTADITAPLYWWKEFDTYKVGTVANSTSTMHKIHSKPITIGDFSFDALGILLFDEEDNYRFLDAISSVIDDCERLRQLYLETNDKKYWRALIQLLPSSYNQKRTVLLNYQVLKNMYHARKNHKLDEWRDFCCWCETLPYFKEVCLEK